MSAMAIFRQLYYLAPNAKLPSIAGPFDLPVMIGLRGTVSYAYPVSSAVFSPFLAQLSFSLAQP